MTAYLDAPLAREHLGLAGREREAEVIHVLLLALLQ
jgi:hypothetical protein